LPTRVTKSKNSIDRYVARIYAKHPGGIKPGDEDFPKSFQGWICKEHGKIICWSCAVRTSTDKTFKEKIIKWIKAEEIARMESLRASKSKPTRKKPTKKAPAKAKKPRKKSSPRVKTSSRTSRANLYKPFEIAVNDVVVAIRELEKHWKSSIITDKNRNKALKYINRSLKSLNDEKEDRFKI
jgi:hypothetical protein